MSDIELLTYEAHQHLKIDSEQKDEYLEKCAYAMIVPNEIVQAQREFPIFFKKDANTGQFYTCVLMSLSGRENLFVKDGQWQTKYSPLTFKRGPFLIGLNKDESGEESAIMYINTGDSKVSETQGESLFDSNGNKSQYLEEVTQVLQDIHHGVEIGKDMIQHFNELKLIEPININIELNNGDKISPPELYTLNLEALENVSAEALQTLTKKGYLGLAYFIASSIGNTQTLVEKQNATL